MGCAVGVDVGGTFTDVCLLDTATGAMAVHKVPSTPEDPSRAIMRGISELLAMRGLGPDDIRSLAHGTTVATNAIIEQRGAKLGLLTTQGFRDLLEIGRQTRPKLYDLQSDYPPPLVPRDLRLEVSERLFSSGAAAVPLDEESARRQIASLKASGVEAIAICFLYSYVNPAHEQRVRDLVREQMPGVYLSLSHEVLPEFREYERLSTTTLNAFLMPVMETYLRNFQKDAADSGIATPPKVNQCNGGIMSVETACRFPIRTVLSGPSAGVTGALFIGETAGRRDLITFDMGGTSTDVSLVRDAAISVGNERWVGGYPARIASVDVNAVGAGGGSIAWVDRDGLVKVGPKSAGALPGPACYGLGGSEPTVTDANVALGRLNPCALLAGRMEISKSKAEEALRRLGAAVGLGPKEMALGVIRIVVANMVRAIRTISIERGFDPKEFALLAFGGAGPLHASSVARELAISTVIVPPNPGLLCALGLLAADARCDYVRTRIMRSRDPDVSLINRIFSELEEEAGEWLSREGFDSENRRISRSVDMRYVGQNFELPVAVSRGPLRTDDIQKLIQAFYREHERSYGHSTPDEPTQLVNFRVTASGLVPRFKLKPPTRPPGSHGWPVIDSRDVIFGDLSPQPTPVYDRAAILPGLRIAGPAIVEQMDATLVLFPGDKAVADEDGNLILAIDSGSEGA